LLDDQGRTEAAIESLRKAVQVTPDYSDAMFNLALMLQRKINVQRPQITGGAISLSTASPNGRAAHADHSNSARCSSI
jgi:hypothetical protein